MSSESLFNGHTRAEEEMGGSLVCCQVRRGDSSLLTVGQFVPINFQMLSRSKEDIIHIPIQRALIECLLCTSNVICKTTHS